MKKFINILFLLMVLIISTPSCAQRIEYDFYKDGLRYIVSNIYHDRLGLIKTKSIYDALYIISNEQLDHILKTTIVGVKIKTGDSWHNKTFKHNKIGEWLKLNYREINKRLNKK